jgi:DNA end-binding protein Ku
MRSIWKGHIRFLLVAIPVRIYNAIETSEKIHFNQLHREDYGPVGYDKRCKKCGKVLANEEITKGYQFAPDRYAIVEPDEIAKIKIKTTKVVDIVGFVDASEIPTTLFDAPYYAGPDGPISDKPYALLHEVLKQTGKVGLGKVVLRDREDLVALFPLENGLVLQKLRYPNELRKVGEIPQLNGNLAIDKNELKLARTLVEQMSTTISELDVVDHYNEALGKLIDSKVAGKKVVEFAEEDVPTVDILTALKQSLQKSKRKPMVRATGKVEKRPAIVEAKPKVVRKRKIA